MSHAYSALEDHVLLEFFEKYIVPSFCDDWRDLVKNIETFEHELIVTDGSEDKSNSGDWDDIQSMLLKCYY